MLSVLGKQPVTEPRYVCSILRFVENSEGRPTYSFISFKPWCQSLRVCKPYLMTCSALWDKDKVGAWLPQSWIIQVSVGRHKPTLVRQLEHSQGKVISWHLLTPRNRLWGLGEAENTWKGWMLRSSTSKPGKDQTRLKSSLDQEKQRLRWFIHSAPSAAPAPAA